MNLKILIADQNHQFGEGLQRVLEDKGCEVKRCTTTEEFGKQIGRYPANYLVLSDQFAKKLPLAQQWFKQYPTIIYHPDTNEQDDLGFYRNGVRRVISASHSTPEHIAHTIRMLDYCRRNIREARRHHLTLGNMKALSLSELLTNALEEQKSLVVKIFHKDWDAFFRVYKGHLVDCQTTYLKDEEAILKTIQFGEGSFIIKGLDKPIQTAKIQASTLAILAEKEYEQQLYHKFLEDFQQLSTNPKVYVDHHKIGENIGDDAAELLQIIDHYETLKEIFRLSRFSFLETLYILKRLAKQRIITFEPPKEPETTPPVQTEKTASDQTIPEKLTPGKPSINLKQPKIAEDNGHSIASTPKATEKAPASKVEHGVVVVLANDARKRFIENIAALYNSSVKSNPFIDMTQLMLTPNLKLTILGMAVKDGVLTALEKIPHKLLGGVLLLDAQKENDWEYGNYIFTQITKLYPNPYVIALTNLNASSVEQVQHFQRTVVLPQGATFRTLQIDHSEDVQALLDYFENLLDTAPSDQATISDKENDNV
jgi:DNA-binding NarL/FixJ family response regulator